MRYMLRIAFLLAVTVGCGSSGITVYKMVGGQPQPIVQVDQRFAGKGCIAVDSDPGGRSSVILQQDGSSDWSAARTFSFAADVLGSMPILGGGGPAARKLEALQPPTLGMQGCEGLFMDETGGSDGDVIKLPPEMPEDERAALRTLVGEAGQ